MWNFARFLIENAQHSWNSVSWCMNVGGLSFTNGMHGDIIFREMFEENNFEGIFAK